MKGNTGVTYRYDDKLIVPIIENTPYEKDLKVHILFGILEIYLVLINVKVY